MYLLQAKFDRNMTYLKWLWQKNNQRLYKRLTWGTCSLNVTVVKRLFCIVDLPSKLIWKLSLEPKKSHYRNRHTSFPIIFVINLVEFAATWHATSFKAASEDILGLFSLTPSFCLHPAAPQWQSWSAPNWTNLLNLLDWTEKTKVVDEINLLCSL